jgi:hypothetical protein
VTGVPSGLLIMCLTICLSETGRGTPGIGDRGHGGQIGAAPHDLLAAGTREGLDAARARDRAGGRRPKLNAAKAAAVRRMYQATGPDGKRLHTVTEIAQTAGIHRTTVYDYLSGRAYMTAEPQDVRHAGQASRQDSGGRPRRAGALRAGP